MSDLSYLDTLSNKELHKKCLEYGLPNIPVAESSRKVILQRLRRVILGTPQAKNAARATTTKRRETVHASKVTPAPVTTNISRVTGNSSSRVSQNNNNYTRRTIAAAPLYDTDTASVRTVQTTTTVSDVGSQSEEDDEYYGVRYSNTKYQDNQRQRRSVSLTKSGVLTTSYTREVEPLRQHNDMDVPQTYTYERPSSTNLHNRPSYSIEPIVESQRLTQTQLNSTSYLENDGYMNIRQNKVPRNTFSGSSTPFASGIGGASSSTLRQQQILNSSSSRAPTGLFMQPKTSVNTLYPKLNEFYDTASQSPVEPMDTSSESDAYENEVRQRSQRTSFASRLPNTFTGRSPLARPQLGHDPVAHNSNTPAQQFGIFLSSLDRQYNLKRYFFIFLAVMILTFIYVLQSPS